MSPGKNFKSSICCRVIVASVISTLCATGNPASAVDYPTSGSNHIATITFTYPQILTVREEGSPVTPADPEHGYFNLSGSGWIRVLAAAGNAPAQADFPADSTINCDGCGCLDSFRGE
jgi:hypothetical protein